MSEYKKFDEEEIRSGKNLYLDEYAPLHKFKSVTGQYKNDHLIILPPEHLNLLDMEDMVFVNTSAFKKMDEIIQLKCIFYRRDFSEIDDEVIFQGLRTLTRGKTQYSSQIKEIIFIDCLISSLTSQMLRNSSNDLPIPIYFIACKINRVFYTYTEILRHNKFRACRIGEFIQKGKIDDEFILYNNTIDILIMQNYQVRLDQLNLKLLYHKNLENSNLNFDNVKFKYDKNIVGEIKKNEHEGYWNTFICLSKLNCLTSEKLDIEKYISYFKSRDSNLNKYERTVKKSLFWFHRGYTKPWPSVYTILIATITSFALLYYGLNQTEYALSYIFNPIKLFSEVVLKDFSFHGIISIPKIFILIFELLIIFGFFTLGITIKKLYGFKIER